MLLKLKANSESFQSFLKELKITNDISFNDDVWDFYQEDNVMLFHVDRAKARINWKRFSDGLPSQMIYEVKQLALIYMRKKDLVAFRVKQSHSGFKDYYVCVIIVKFLKFLEVIYKNSVVHFGTTMQLKDSHIFSLFDLTLDDLRFGIQNYIETGIPSIKGILNNLCSSEVFDEIDQDSENPKIVKWNRNDIRTLKVLPSKDVSFLRQPIERYLDDSVLKLLLKKSTIIVHSFCEKFGIVDKKSGTVSGNSLLKILYDFKIIREIGKSKNHKERWRFKKNYGNTAGSFGREMADVQVAAFYIIFQLTGARYSEAIHFTTSNMTVLDTGYWVLKGMVIKKRVHKSITDTDYWVITEVTFKAVLALQAINTVYGHDYLLAPSVRTKPMRGKKPVRLNSVTNQLKKFFRKCDTEGIYHDLKSKKLIDKKFMISPHRIRHTLTREMIRCNLNLAQISYHFKHVYIGHLFLKKPSNVTLGYGGLNSAIFNDAVSLKSLRGDLIDSFINPNTPMSGGSGPKLKKRAVDFFKGSISAGVDSNVVKNQILKSGEGFNDIGIGFCTGVRKVVSPEGSNTLPSCITNQHCDNVLCQNSFFIKSKLPHLKAMLQSYEDKLSNPQLIHYRQYYLKFVERLNEVIFELENSPQ